MLAKVVATFAVMALMFLNALGNFWFTYGIWPRSWWSFALFFLTGFALHQLFTAVTKKEAQ